MKKRCLIGLTMLVLTLFVPSTLFAQDIVPPEAKQTVAVQLAQQAEGVVSIRERAGTGVAGFVRVSPGGDLMPTAQSRTTVDKASTFFATYGALFGIADPASELTLVNSQTDYVGDVHLTYQQLFQGVEVYGAQLKAHYGSGMQLTAVNGVFVPAIQVNTSPVLSAAQAGEIALEAVASDGDVSAAGYAIAANQLRVYRMGLVQGVAGDDSLVYEVEVVNDAINAREFVFVDAHTGKIVDRYSGVQDALFRRLYELNTANQVWQEGDTFPGGLNQDQQNIVTAGADSYYFFFNAFGRDSYNGAGAEMKSVNNDPGINCPNANWNGSTTNYCTGVSSDDVVAHEWGHAYTEYTNGLIYQWQSGALNEAYSDIWGETIDMLNTTGTDAPALDTL